MPVKEYPDADIDLFEFRFRDMDTGEVFYQSANSWERLDAALMSMAKHRGHGMEIWIAPRIDVDPLLPPEALPLDEEGQIAAPWDRFAWTHYSRPWLMNGPSMGAVEGWVVTHDGETIVGPFEKSDDAYVWLHKRSSQSWDWAIRYEGYDVVNVRDGEVVWSYKRDELPNQRPSDLGAIELIELGDGAPEDFYADYELGAKVVKRTALAKGKQIAAKVERWLKPYARRLLLAGSVRRKRPTIGDIEFVILPKKSLGVEGLAAALEECGYRVGPSMRTAKKMVDGVKVELYIVHYPEEFGAMAFMYTGDRTFNMAMRKKAMAMGYLLNQYGVWTRDKKRAILQSPNERDFFDLLQVPYHTPEERSFKDRTSEERRRMKARQARMKGLLGEDEQEFFTRLESVWDEPTGEERR